MGKKKTKVTDPFKVGEALDSEKDQILIAELKAEILKGLQGRPKQTKIFESLFQSKVAKSLDQVTLDELGIANFHNVDAKKERERVTSTIRYLSESLMDLACSYEKDGKTVVARFDREKINKVQTYKVVAKWAALEHSTWENSSLKTASNASQISEDGLTGISSVREQVSFWSAHARSSFTKKVGQTPYVNVAIFVSVPVFFRERSLDLVLRSMKVNQIDEHKTKQDLPANDPLLQYPDASLSRLYLLRGEVGARNLIEQFLRWEVQAVYNLRIRIEQLLCLDHSLTDAIEGRTVIMISSPRTSVLARGLLVRCEELLPGKRLPFMPQADGLLRIDKDVIAGANPKALEELMVWLRTTKWATESNGVVPEVLKDYDFEENTAFAVVTRTHHPDFPSSKEFVTILSCDATRALEPVARALTSTSDPFAVPLPLWKKRAGITKWDSTFQLLLRQTINRTKDVENPSDVPDLLCWWSSN